MSFLQKIFDFIGKLFQKIIDLIKKVLPFILLAVAAYLFWGVGAAQIGWPWLSSVGLGSLTGTSGAILAAGASFLIAPEESAAVVARVATGVGAAVGSVVAAGVGVVTTGVSAFFSSPIGLATLGVGLYLLFGRDDQNDSVTVTPLVEKIDKPVSGPTLERKGAYA